MAKRQTFHVIAPHDTALDRHMSAAFGDTFAKGFVPHNDLADVTPKSKTDPVVVCLTHPVEAVADLIAVSASPSAALAQWTASTTDLLKAARRMRRQLVVVDTRAVLTGQPQALAALDGLVAKSMPAAPDTPPALDLIFADCLLRHDDTAQRLVAELDALRRGEAVAVVDADLLDGSYGEVGAATRDEIDLLRENIEHQHEDMQQSAARYAALVSEHETLGQTVADRHVLKAENDAMVRRLEIQSTDTAARESTLSAVLLDDQQKLAKAEAEIAALRDELGRLYGSSSWRVTRPLRSVRSKFRSHR